jgi:hypothetical protein
MLPGQTRITPCGADVLDVHRFAGDACQCQTCPQYLPAAFAAAAVYENALHIVYRQ